MNCRTLTRLERGEEPGPESSLVKLFWASLTQRVHELGLRSRGSARPARGGITARRRERPLAPGVPLVPGGRDRRRHVRGAGQHHRTAHARPAALTRAFFLDSPFAPVVQPAPGTERTGRKLGEGLCPRSCRSTRSIRSSCRSPPAQRSGSRASSSHRAWRSRCTAPRAGTSAGSSCRRDRARLLASWLERMADESEAGWVGPRPPAEH